MFVDRQRIARAAGRVGQIGVAFVMVLVDLLVKNLREADRHRLENAEGSIEHAALEIWIVQKVVRDAVDVPRDADRPDEAERNQRPPRESREGDEKKNEVGELRESCQYRDGVVCGVLENRGV